MFKNKDTFIEEIMKDTCEFWSENDVTYRKVYEILKKYIKWYEKQKEAELIMLIVLQQIHHFPQKIKGTLQC